MSAPPGLQELAAARISQGTAVGRPFVCRGWLAHPDELGHDHPGWQSHQVEACRMPREVSDVGLASFRLREMGKTVRMPVRDIFERLLQPIPAPDEHYYVFGGTTPAPFLDARYWPAGHDYVGSSHYIASKNVRARLHYDLWEVFLLQVHGAKRLLLYPPSAYSFLYAVHDRQSGLSRRSRMDIRNPDFQQFPLARRLPAAIEVILQPGDLLYLPCRWWHEVEALSFSIGFNRRFTRSASHYFLQMAVHGWQCLKGRYWYRSASDLPLHIMGELMRSGLHALKR